VYIIIIQCSAFLSAAQTVTATARVTNVNFTEDFLNSSSQAYLDFTATLLQEVCWSLRTIAVAA